MPKFEWSMVFSTFVTLCGHCIAKHWISYYNAIIDIGFWLRVTILRVLAAIRNLLLVRSK